MLLAPEEVTGIMVAGLCFSLLGCDAEERLMGCLYVNLHTRGTDFWVVDSGSPPREFCMSRLEFSVIEEDLNLREICII